MTICTKEAITAAIAANPTDVHMYVRKEHAGPQHVIALGAWCNQPPDVFAEGAVALLAAAEIECGCCVPALVVGGQTYCLPIGQFAAS